jgi:hypothetical protein
MRKIVSACFVIIITLFSVPIAFCLGGLDAVTGFDWHEKLHHLLETVFAKLRVYE